jgi:hypothetical protein
MAHPLRPQTFVPETFSAALAPTSKFTSKVRY